MAADGMATEGARASVVCVYFVLAEYSGLSTRLLSTDVGSVILVMFCVSWFALCSVFSHHIKYKYA